jgi:hypothetical protein
MAAHVMVLANRTAAAPELVDALLHRSERGPIVATLIMPAPGAGTAARAAARERLDSALAVWRAAGIERCDGVVCDTGPLEALTEAWDPMRHDEVIVCTLPGESSRWIRSDLPHQVARYTGVSVLHVVARDPEAGPAPSSAPAAHEKAALGPLSVLAWGGRR